MKAFRTSVVISFLSLLEHDGLVAKESQFYPKKYSDKILGNQNVGYDSYPEYNHMTIVNQTTKTTMGGLLDNIK